MTYLEVWVMERAPYRKLQVNPEPLKIVEVRAGEARPGPEPRFTIHRAMSPRTGKITRISVHGAGCPRTPHDCYPKEYTSDEVSQALARADSHGARQAICCRVCGGWRVS